MGLETAQKADTAGVKVTASDMKILDMATLMAVLKQVTDNKSAVDCAQSVINIASVWDNTIDGDPLEESTAGLMVDKAFLDATFMLDTNEFWATYKAFLMPVWIMSINGYLDSRVFEKQLDDDVALEMAFCARLFVYEMFSAIAFCAGGFDAMRTVSLSVRRSAHYLSVEEWKAKMRAT